MATDKERITHLEFIINEIDGALCQYCNEVNDPYDPPSEWKSGVRSAFRCLCDAYNLWHVRNKEIGDISQRFFAEHERYAMVLRGIASGHHYSTIERAVAAAKEALDDAARAKTEATM